MDIRSEVFLQGEVYKTDDVGVLVNDDETKAAFQDAGHGRYKVLVWPCAVGLDGKSFLEPFRIKGFTRKGEPGKSLQCQTGPGG
jgi:hypothetical protein